MGRNGHSDMWHGDGVRVLWSCGAVDEHAWSGNRLRPARANTVLDIKIQNEFRAHDALLLCSGAKRYLSYNRRSSSASKTQMLPLVYFHNLPKLISLSSCLFRTFAVARSKSS